MVRSRSLAGALLLASFGSTAAFAHPAGHPWLRPAPRGPRPLSSFARALPSAGAAQAPLDTPKRIYLALDDHTDYVWTADAPTYRQAFLDMLHYYLDLADTTQSNADSLQSRFNADGTWWLWEYERHATADWPRLVDRLRSGHITAPRNTLVQVYGGTPAEAVLRGLYYSGRLERRYRLRFPLALEMENQTMPFGLGSLWAGAGVEYSWQGICGCASEVPDAWNREADAYRWIGRDGSSILVKWNSMLNGNQSLGGYAEARDPVAAIAYVDGNAGFQARWSWPVIGVFGVGWDDLQTLRADFPGIAQAQSNASRQVRVSNEIDFFDDFGGHYGAALPALSVSYGNEWELCSAAYSEVTAGVRRSVEKLRSAEALATLVSRLDPTFLDGRESLRDQAFADLGLFWEHDLCGGGSVGDAGRATFQRALAAEIATYVDDLQADGLVALGAAIAGTASNPRYFVFNPLSWVRTDAADLPYSGPFPVHVVEVGSGATVPSQVVSVDGATRLRILAPAVPSLGYKTFDVVSGAGTLFADAATADATARTLENARHRLTLGPRGAITSWLDKSRANREMVRSIGGRTANDLGGSGSGTVTIENAGAVSVTLKVVAASPLQHTTRITLFRSDPTDAFADVERVAIDDRIEQNFTDLRTWDFGFELDGATLRHEEVGAILTARLRPAGGDYSERNARYDWLSFQHFADLANAANGVTVSNADLDFFRFGASTTTTLDTATPKLGALAGGRPNGFGIPGQDGTTAFLQRFALRSHGGYDPAAAMRFALEHQNPLVAAAVAGSGSAYPAATYSLLQVSDPDLLVWSVKPAEEGIAAGIVVRLWNLAESARSFSLSLDGGIPLAEQVTHVETRRGPASLDAGQLLATAASQQLLTFRLGAVSSATFSDSFERGHTREWSARANGPW